MVIIPVGVPEGALMSLRSPRNTEGGRAVCHERSIDPRRARTGERSPGGVHREPLAAGRGPIHGPVRVERALGNGDNGRVSEQPEHYFSEQPAVDDRERVIVFELDGVRHELTTSTGVFSGNRLDPGTNVLLSKVVPPEEAGTFLDLGCGYGPISAVLAQREDAEVWAVDVNRRALELARRNTERSPGTVRVATPEEVPESVRFDEIWSNPPIKVGKEALHGLLETWLPRLKPGGTAWLVVSKHLGSDSLARWLNEQGWHTGKHASAKGYRVLRVTQGDQTGD